MLESELTIGGIAESHDVGQLDIAKGIVKSLSDLGIDRVSVRQFNAILTAATTIADALGTAHTPAVPGMGLEAWLACDDTGLSSLFMAHVIFGTPQHAQNYHPVDPDDFGRCYRFLLATTPARSCLYRLKEYGPYWSALVDAWDELEIHYREQSPGGDWSNLSARMTEILNEARKQDAASGA